MADLLIFDLDGTLSDSAPGILAALRHAFAVNDVAPLDPRTEQALLGPPFYTSLPPLIGGESKLPGVLAAYREAYGSGGMFDTTAYDGVADVLAAARAGGRRLAVATSKPEPYAVPIVEHLGLSGFFDTVGGDTLDGGRATKALVVGEVLARLGADPSDAVMIGDREHDVYGAREHGIPCVGAGWGYGLPGELAEAGADPICAHPSELVTALGLVA
ncbi:HAD hydrolase-like protein [Jatrophihabitans endophyticus]|uniref:HAD hydrolase-like protein n=1 Tax=Jatrophihabitans endophyticus TaxID=1206085 RepID=UPI0019D88A1B|nr:HAD hydrolase-like protein [Jatrophihabitans endophyticus]MBE7187184.1 HAD hydrolase-like protein [Jatrophihabitans endophyticus]